MFAKPRQIIPQLSRGPVVSCYGSVFTPDSHGLRRSTASGTDSAPLRAMLAVTIEAGHPLARAGQSRVRRQP